MTTSQLRSIACLTFAGYISYIFVLATAGDNFIFPSLLLSQENAKNIFVLIHLALVSGIILNIVAGDEESIGPIYRDIAEIMPLPTFLYFTEWMMGGDGLIRIFVLSSWLILVLVFANISGIVIRFMLSR
ncbi:MAG: hypothetical protein ACKKL4_00115 [Patescibacteria group bacterium]